MPVPTNKKIRSVSYNGTNIPLTTLPIPIVAGEQIIEQSSNIISFSEPSSTDWVATSSSITVQKAGTYRFRWVFGACIWANYRTSSGYTQLYKNGVAIGSTYEYTSSEGVGFHVCTEDVVCVAGDVLTVWCKPWSFRIALIVSGNAYMAGCLTASIDWDIYG